MNGYIRLTGFACSGFAFILAQQVQAETAVEHGKNYTLSCGGNYSSRQEG